MATAPLPPIAGASYLEQLPAELIENIPLEVVKDVEPPVKWDMEGHTILRCQVQYGGKTNSSNASTLLAHRLASHTLRNSAWRALAKVIGETIFDIRSKESVENLVAISHCEVLAPWIHKLTVGCFTVDDIYPSLTSALHDCLIRLQNLVHVHHYYELGHIPARFRKLAVKYYRDPNFSLCWEGELGPSFGLRILVEAMVIARVTPKVMDLAVDLNTPDSFHTFKPTTEINSIFRKVDKLTLRDRYEVRDHEHDTAVCPISTPLTTTIFPSLRSLVLDAGVFDDAWRTYPLPPAHLSDLVNLESL
jgi:hypothetical protein